jgi:hypothetical protein
MSETKNSSGCGCCKGLTALTPQSLENLPGLSALAYRVGTHGSFKATMLTDLTERNGLGQLTSRDDDDPSIALLDASAVILDVLTFYQERIINQGYLRTATERRSILELARQIGYELAPGVAASTYLAFTLEDAAGAPGKATIPIGTRVQSLPGQDEKPQSFETVEAISAEAAWNEMKPRTTRLVYPGFQEDEVYLKGVSNNLKAGDALLIVGTERLNDTTNENWDFRRIKSVEIVTATDPEDSYTLVTLEYGLGSLSPYKEPARQAPRVYVLRQRANLFGYNAPDWKGMVEEVRKAYCTMIGDSTAFNDPDWPDLTIGSVSGIASGTIDTIYLDQAYAQVRPGGWIVLSRNEYQEVYEVDDAVEDARARFSMSGKSTRMVLKGEYLRKKFDEYLRETVVFCQSEELEWAEQPDTRPLSGDLLTIDEPVSGLLAKRILIVSGKPCRVKDKEDGFRLHLSDGSHIMVPEDESAILTKAPSPLENGKLRWTVQTKVGKVGTLDRAEHRIVFLSSEDSDETVAEVVTIKTDPVPGVDTTDIELEQPLAYYYDRATVSVYGNVALATHGETKKEVLGSGDASHPFQKFTLKNSPLTYVSEATATGTETTLEVRVDDILWKEVDSFYDLDKRKRAFVTRRDDDGKVTVEFGDGLTGARLPTGSENVSAVYRIGIGSDGMVKAGQFSLLMSQVLGVKKVTNPLAPSGAADPETRDKARQNAPFTVLTLGRVVSLQDFEDFARAFAGIGKAQAEWLWDGEARVVHLTIAASTASAGDYRVATTSKLYKNLRAGIDAARDTTQRLLLATHAPLSFRVKARLLIAPDYLPDKVVKAAKSALKEAYQFSERLFGQSVSRGEILALLQGVAGVKAAFLDALYLTGEEKDLSDLLTASRARWVGTQVQPAELLLIDTAGISVEAIQS